MIWVNDVPEESSKLIYAADMSTVAGIDVDQFASLEQVNAAVLGFFFSEGPLYEFNPLATLVTEMGPAAEDGRRESRREGNFTVTLFRFGPGFQLEIADGSTTNVQTYSTVQECIDFAEEVYYDYRDRLEQPTTDRQPPLSKESPIQYLDGRSILDPDQGIKPGDI